MPPTGGCTRAGAEQAMMVTALVAASALDLRLESPAL